MAISYPLTLPTEPNPTSRVMRAMDSVSVSESPFTYETQVVSYGGDMWTLEVTWPAMTAAQAQPLIAVLLALRGRFGTFVFPGTTVPIRGTLKDHASVPVVRGAHTAGERELRIKMGRASQTAYFRAGDIIQLGSGAGARLHQVVEDANTNASGESSLEIWPRLRAAYTDAAAIGTGDRTRVGVWRLAANERMFSVDALHHYGLTLACREAL